MRNKFFDSVCWALTSENSFDCAKHGIRRVRVTMTKKTVSLRIALSFKFGIFILIHKHGPRRAYSALHKRREFDVLDITFS